MEISDVEIHPEYFKEPKLWRGFDIALCKIKFKDGNPFTLKERAKLNLP